MTIQYPGIIFLVLSFSILSCKGGLYRNPSAGMEETIKSGETFSVNRTSSFKRNDIVVFNFWGEDYSAPVEETGKYKMNWQKWVKRLIAVSGDSIQLKDGDVFINGNIATPPPGSLMEYDVYSMVGIDDFPKREYSPFAQTDKRGDTFHYTVILTSTQAADYSQRKPTVVRVEKKKAFYDLRDTSFIRPFEGCEWTPDDFGPLKIPRVGDTIVVNELNARLYRNITGIHPGENIIREPLYFVLGDNRHFSQDSRYIGYISHSNMYGVVK